MLQANMHCVLITADAVGLLFRAVNVNVQYVDSVVVCFLRFSCFTCLTALC